MHKARLAFALSIVALWAGVIMALSGGNAPASAADAKKPVKPPHVVFMVGEDEYKTAETLPEFAKSELESAGVRCTFIHADAKDPNNFTGLEKALADADLLFVSVRRRTPTESQLAAIRKHLDAGKPLVGIRTASHAFALREGSPKSGYAEWKTFDVDILGGRYENHYANKTGTDVTSVPHTERNPILAAAAQPSLHSGGTLYKSRDVNIKGVILKGFTRDKDGAVVEEPVAWTNVTKKKSRVFYTSLGHPDDFKDKTFRTILTNAVFWAMNKPGPNEAAYQAALKQASTERNKLNADEAANAEVLEFMKKFAGKGEVGDDSKPTEAITAVTQFQVINGLEMEIVAHEPQVAQPLNINFDACGRMWVVQYLQYPFPAGLKVVKYDQYLRAVFDKVPEPPPHGVKGKDKITVLEDTDGDGKYDKVRDVITGLNIASSVLVGRGGIWVLNPPYLLFYPDRNGDDIPDGDPSVEISGFGLEDTHSVANSLTWGPDGWIYAANGSTSTATITTAATKNLHFKGQCIWRFHPDTKVFEIFGEGGGNTFSMEFDAKGRAYSGTNHGDTRGMHYDQGMYGEKNFGKHGPLTNPYAFGHFEHMRHEGFKERFPQTFMIYEGAVWPKKYEHNVIHANSLHNRVQASDLQRDGSTWRTKDTDLLVLTPDRWFRPVDIKAGPDGNVYMADWYDSRLTHVDPRDNWHKTSGRIYRLKASGSSPAPRIDLTKVSSDDLIAQLSNPNKWWRQQAQVVIGDRKDRAMLPALQKLLDSGDDQLALESLWAIYKIAGLDEATQLKALAHRDEHVRRWAVRLIGDQNKAAEAAAARLTEMAAKEPAIEVRSQIASTAKRLPGPVALPMIRQLMARGEDVDDPRLPLLIWWALESKAESDRSAVLELFSDKSVWSLPMVEKHLLDRTMRRYTMAGGQENLITASYLLKLAPTPTHSRKLMAGLEDAFKGRVLTDLPPELTRALSEYQDSIGNTDIGLGLRLGKKEAIAAAAKVIADEKSNKSERMKYVETIGQIKAADAVPTLLSTLQVTKNTALKRVILAALSNFDDAAIGQRVVHLYHTALPETDNVRAAAYGMLTSRPAWTLQLLKEIDESRIKPQAVPMDVVQKMGMHSDTEIQRLVTKHWGRVRSTPAEKQQQIARLAQVIKSGAGDAAAGKALYAVCSACHKLFNEGGNIGPDLTGYERTNLDFMLLAIVDPSAGIREEYTNFVLTTKDGRTLTGFLGDQNDRTVAIKGLDGQTQTISRDQVASINALPVSIMPEGLLSAYSDQQIRDLFAYLMSSPPVKK